MTEDALAIPLDLANSYTALERYENANDNDFTFLTHEMTIMRLLLVNLSTGSHSLELKPGRGGGRSDQLDSNGCCYI